MTARGVAVTATVVVAVVAAITSYDHMRTLAERAGEGWKAFLIPLAVDGLVVAASTVLVVRRRAGMPSGLLPWVAWLGGVGASVAANVAAAQPTMIGRAIAVVPPLALAVSFELLRVLMSAAHPVPPTESPTDTHPPGDPLPQPADDADLDVVDRAAAIIAAAEQNGRQVGRRTLARELGVTEHQARGLLDRLTRAAPVTADA